jgi:plastocyanin
MIGLQRSERCSLFVALLRAWLPAVALLLSGCTAGGEFAASSGGAGASSVTTVDVSIAAFGAQTTPGGTGLGFSPEVATIAVGSGVRFVNVDNTTHTVTAIPGATTFPAQSPFSSTALQPSATADISGSWGAGALQAGQSSGVFIADQAGTYLFGCFFHYSGGMRGAIVAK